MKLQIDDLGNVGIIVEDWNIGRSYKPRTLTTDYSTWITYISRKAVPAGIELTNIGYWKPIARLSKDLAFDYQKFKESVNNEVSNLASTIVSFGNRIDDLYNQMQSFLETASGGTAISKNYGNSDLVGVSQRTLTTTINGLYKLIGDAIGVDINNVIITVNPTSFIGNEAAPVNISAVCSYGLFDYVKVYFDGELVIEKNNIETFTETLSLTKTTTIRVEAMVLGETYSKTQVVTMTSDFFVGAGSSYEDVYNPTYARVYNGDPTGAYPVEVKQGDRIFVIIPTQDDSKIEQIEMNDFNIPMDKSTFGIYTVYTSMNTYTAGNYTIDINY